MKEGGGELLLLNAAAVAQVLRGEELLAAVADALIGYSAGRADSPPRAGARTPGGWLGAMPAYLEPAALAAKLVTVFPGNDAAGLPSHQGVIALFETESGQPVCVMDARRITALRTAAVSALSVRELAPPGARVLAVLGAGEQARSHLELVPSVHSFAEVRIAARSRERADRLAQDFPAARVVPTFAAAVQGADVVVCCTNSPDPILRRDWVVGAAHLVSVGMGAELDRETIAAARVFVEWRGALSSPPPAGAIELQGLDPAAATELGEVLSGARPGRRSAAELTVFKSTGLGVEDAAAARTVYEAARARGVGVRASW